MTRFGQAAALACLVLTLVSTAPRVQAGCSIAVDSAEAAILADRIWRNESAGDWDKILWWNPGENFASLGIGHFIWYPAGVDGPFKESFPQLLGFLAAGGASIPAWLGDEPYGDCPWSTREQFLAARNGADASELRRLLLESVAQQAQFMLARLSLALDAILASVPAPGAGIIESRFCALASTPAGRYALLDYVNFKGEGIEPGERYAGQGWGLSQALQNMRGTYPANVDFAESAAKLLRQRVANAPPGRGEQRWLAGWLRRVESYR